MDTFNLPFTTASWIHHAPDAPQVQDSSSSDDWTKDRSSQQNIDLSDHGFAIGDIQDTLLTSLPASSSTSSTMTPAQSFYHSYSMQPTNFYAPYNVMAYGQGPWSQSSPLPLSSYSTLNGATGNSTPVQRSQPEPQPMMIDPALTVNATNGTHQYSPPTQSQQPPQSHNQQLQLQHPRSPPLSINPILVHGSHQQPQQPSTLSPSLLHQPSQSMNSFSPSMFYSLSQVQPAPVLSLQDLRKQIQDKIRASLTPSALSSASAVKTIVAELEAYGSQDVDPPFRLEIINKVRDQAGNHFFRAWAENQEGMDIFREWLKAGATGKDDGRWDETIMPLLQVIDRLPLSIEGLKSSKLGKIILKLAKEPPNSAAAIKDMASNIERKWRSLVNETTKKTDNSSMEDKNKKRKLSDGTAAKTAPPAKKTATALSTVSAATSRGVVVKKESKVVSAVKEAKSDSSFFSAPKPKPKLPSFKKAPPAPAKKEPDANVAQPNAIDPFQEALKLMAKNRNSSPAVSTPPQISASASSATAPSRTSKKRKSVSWAADDQLEKVRLIERAIYDDDPVDGAAISHNIRDLDRDEGAALHAHLFEEAIDWSEPLQLAIPSDIDAKLRGSESVEKNEQEEREKSALSALYMTAAQIPDSPAEPTHQISEEEVDAHAKPMLPGSDIQAFFANASSVADLVGQLSSTTGVVPGMDDSAASMAAAIGPLASLDLRSLGLDPATLSTLTSLTQQFMGSGTAGGAGGSGAQFDGGQGYSNGNMDPGWNNYLPPPQSQQPQDQAPYSEYGYDDERGKGGRRDHGWSSRGRGGRGRGRGEGGYRNKRKPCSFFAAGRCKYGDQCDFSHDAAY